MWNGKKEIASPVDDGHPHDWYDMLVGPEGMMTMIFRCAECHTLRCGPWADADPCLDRVDHLGPCVHELTGIR